MNPKDKYPHSSPLVSSLKNYRDLVQGGFGEESGVRE
jgi:hypothetical protein